MEIEKLKNKARQIRIEVIEMIYRAGSGHPGGSLSCVEIMISLYYKFLRVKPNDPNWPDRDRFILSKGHACPTQYAILADLGFFKKNELLNLRKLGSILQGHPDFKTPGVDMPSGSLGQGLSFANGVALAAKLDKKDFLVYVLLGDGEIQEGEIWEAAMTSAKYKLDNLICFIDNNKIQNDDFVSKVMPEEPLKKKWETFNWYVDEINGHNFKEIIEAIKKAKKVNGMPKMIIANTVKGKGISFMENNPEFHGRSPTKEEYEKALFELNETN